MDFLAFAPVTGLFLIKLAKGRMLREFIVINWIVPSVFGMVWFAVFGGLALDIQYNYGAYADRMSLEGCASLFDYMQEFGNEAVMLKVVEAIPHQLQVSGRAELTVEIAGIAGIDIDNIRCPQRKSVFQLDSVMDIDPGHSSGFHGAVSLKNIWIFMGKGNIPKAI